MKIMVANGHGGNRNGWEVAGLDGGYQRIAPSMACNGWAAHQSSVGIAERGGNVGVAMEGKLAIMNMAEQHQAISK